MLWTENKGKIVKIQWSDNKTGRKGGGWVSRSFIHPQDRKWEIFLPLPWEPFLLEWKRNLEVCMLAVMFVQNLRFDKQANTCVPKEKWKFASRIHKYHNNGNWKCINILVPNIKKNNSYKHEYPLNRNFSEKTKLKIAQAKPNLWFQTLFWISDATWKEKKIPTWNMRRCGALHHSHRNFYGFRMLSLVQNEM